MNSQNLLPKFKQNSKNLVKPKNLLQQSSKTLKLAAKNRSKLKVFHQKSNKPAKIESKPIFCQKLNKTSKFGAKNRVKPLICRQKLNKTPKFESNPKNLAAKIVSNLKIWCLKSSKTPKFKSNFQRNPKFGNKN